jgi:hypothetical protein
VPSNAGGFTIPPLIDSTARPIRFVSVLVSRSISVCQELPLCYSKFRMTAFAKSICPPPVRLTTALATQQRGARESIMWQRSRFD